MLTLPGTEYHGYWHDDWHAPLGVEERIVDRDENTHSMYGIGAKLCAHTGLMRNTR